MYRVSGLCHLISFDSNSSFLFICHPPNHTHVRAHTHTHNSSMLDSFSNTVILDFLDC